MKPETLAILILPGAFASLGGGCPPAGPILPPPKIPGHFNPSGLSVKLERLVKSSSLSWNATTTSFSIGMTSKENSFFEYHRTAPVRNASGTARVDADTVYRVASITKIFNVLTTLLNAPESLDLPVANFVPELKGVEKYEAITLRMLASQVSGIARDGNAFDTYTSEGEILQQGGFPVPPPGDIPHCDNVIEGPCSRSEFFQNLLGDKPTWMPADRAAYSDQAYTLLAWALENITNKTFEELLESSVTQPLNLSSTGFDAPDLSRAIVPQGQAGIFMGFDIGSFNSTAGLYSTPSDISSFLRSILRHSLLTPTQTRQWLKPSAFAGSFWTAVGMPWEIVRLSNLTPDRRPIDVYTKSGDIPGYSAFVAVLPDYEAALTVHTAGDNAYSSSLELLDAALVSLVPALDNLARAQAKKQYVGRYTGYTTHGKKTDKTALSLTIDDGPGLRIKEWTHGSKSILKTLAEHSGIAEEKLVARLYPVGDGKRWRLARETSGFPVDAFDFVIKDGRVLEVKNLGLRASYEKQHGN